MRPIHVRLASIVLSALTAATPSVAAAQAGGCTTDIQCKGNRICVNRQCQDPNAPPPPVPPPPAVTPSRQPAGTTPTPGPFIVDDGSQSYVQGETGWTRGAGILGLVSAAAIIGLGTAGAVAANNFDEEIALPFAGASTVVGGVLLPISASGGNSGAERGPSFVRILGWVTYGLFMGMAVVTLFAWYVDDLSTLSGNSFFDFTPYIAASTSLGAISSTLFAVNGFLSYNASKAPLASNTNELVPLPPPPKYSFALGRVLDRDAEPVPTVGFRFTY